MTGIGVIAAPNWPPKADRRQPLRGIVRARPPQPKPTAPDPKSLLSKSATERQGNVTFTAAERNKTAHGTLQASLLPRRTRPALLQPAARPRSTCCLFREIPGCEPASVGGHENCPRLDLAVPDFTAVLMQAGERGPQAACVLVLLDAGTSSQGCRSRFGLPHKNSNSRLTSSGPQRPLDPARRVRRHRSLGHVECRTRSGLFDGWLA